VFKRFHGDWLELRRQYAPREVDLHFSGSGSDEPYWKKMDEVRELVEAELRRAHADGVPWLLFRHGYSTSEGWRDTTSRSIVRSLMRSKQATPMIVRRECIQHGAVFLVRLRDRAAGKAPVAPRTATVAEAQP
jgi:hypothetical protein